MPNVVVKTSEKFFSKVTYFLAIRRMQKVKKTSSANYKSDVGLGAKKKPLKKTKFRRIKGCGFE